MADTDRTLAVATGQDELAHGSLRIWDAIAISVSVIAPGMAMLLNVSGVAIVAGGSTPLAARRHRLDAVPGHHLAGARHRRAALPALQAPGLRGPHRLDPW